MHVEFEEGAIYVKVSKGHWDKQTDILEENEKQRQKKMPRHLEANKKRRLQHWEKSMHLIFTQGFYLWDYLAVKTDTEDKLFCHWNK